MHAHIIMSIVIASIQSYHINVVALSPGSLSFSIYKQKRDTTVCNIEKLREPGMRLLMFHTQ